MSKKDSDNPNKIKLAATAAATAAAAAMGYESDFAAESVSDISLIGHGANVYTMFIDAADSAKDVFVYLADISCDRGVKVCLVGEPMELAKAEKYMKVDNVAAAFERPAYVKEIVQKVDVLWKEAAIQMNKKSILLVDDDPLYLRYAYKF